MFKDCHRIVVAAAGAASALAASPAVAHHAMGGQLPSTFAEGLLSGLAHPVIGPDHLAFLLAIGIAAAIVPAGARLVAAFVAASTAGVLAHAGTMAIPMSEALIAISVVVAGGLLATTGKGATRSAAWLALATIAGLLHGYAFGETIVGAERPVLGAYLMGLALVAAAICLTVAAGVRRLLHADRRQQAVPVRLAGLALGSAGVVMLAASLVAV